jgi:hypothetical protein
MNIFILSWIIEHCAKYHCDKHVVKMILETTQLLSTCHHVVNPVQAQAWTRDNMIYHKTHQNHPSSIWTRECRENYIWLCYLGLALCNEYAYRYDKKSEDHKCHSKLMFLITHVPDLPSNNGTITIPKQAMPDQYKSNDPVLAYRTYYVNDKNGMLVWRKRGPPSWVPKSLHHTHYQSEIKRLSSNLSKINNRTRKTADHVAQIEQINKELNKLKTEYQLLLTDKNN